MLLGGFCGQGGGRGGGQRRVVVGGLEVGLGLVGGGLGDRDGVGGDGAGVGWGNLCGFVGWVGWWCVILGRPVDKVFFGSSLGGVVG